MSVPWIDRMTLSRSASYPAYPLREESSDVWIEYHNTGYHNTALLRHLRLTRMVGSVSSLDSSLRKKKVRMLSLFIAVLASRTLARPIDDFFGMTVSSGGVMSERAQVRNGILREKRYFII